MEHHILRKQPTGSKIQEVIYFSTVPIPIPIPIHVHVSSGFWLYPKTRSYPKGSDKEDDREATIRKLYGLELTDRNVTFALCCGTRSSPTVSSMAKVYL